jgi:hypothetical protein
VHARREGGVIQIRFKGFLHLLIHWYRPGQHWGLRS